MTTHHEAIKEHQCPEWQPQHYVSTMGKDCKRMQKTAVMGLKICTVKRKSLCGLICYLSKIIICPSIGEDGYRKT